MTNDDYKNQHCRSLTRNPPILFIISCSAFGTPHKIFKPNINNYCNQKKKNPKKGRYTKELMSYHVKLKTEQSYLAIIFRMHMSLVHLNQVIDLPIFLIEKV
jgi:hypothetical protein